MYEEAGLELNKQQAGMMIAAVISDTLFFRSPTTTDQDRYIVDELNQIAQIEDLEAFSLEMFDAKGDLSDYSPEEIITLDYKPFDFNGNKFTIGVMETTNPKFALDMKSELIAAQKDIKSREGLNGILFFVVDILNENSKAIVCGEFEEQTVLKAFGASVSEEGVLDAGHIVSRKKQIVPKLEEFFA